MATWKIRDAKTHFSDLMKASGKEPQIISNREQKIRAVIDIELFMELMKLRENSQKPTIKQLVDNLHQLDETISLPKINRKDRIIDLAHFHKDDK